MRGDYLFTHGTVDNWWNVYARDDLIQRLGGRIPFFGGRTNPAARNFSVDTEGGLLGHIQRCTATISPDCSGNCTLGAQAPLLKRRATIPTHRSQQVAPERVLPLRALMNRLPICLITLLLAVFFPVYARVKPHYTFILPDQYVGWVQIVFNDPGASPFPVRRDGGREIAVPESGIPRTSGLRVHDVRGKDEFYYLSVLPNGKVELRPVASEYVLPGVGHGGFGVAGTGGRGTGGGSWFLFIGPPEVRAKFPDADWDKVVAEFAKTHGGKTRIESSGPYPTPGRIARDFLK
jgi:hypothetical protein